MATVQSSHKKSRAPLMHENNVKEVLPFVSLQLFPLVLTSSTLLFPTTSTTLSMTLLLWDTSESYIQDIQLMVICICTLYMMYTVIKVHVRFKF
jgi:hypothetical protein